MKVKKEMTCQLLLFLRQQKDRIFLFRFLGWILAWDQSLSASHLGSPCYIERGCQSGNHARFWLAYLPPTHVMSVRMVSLASVSDGGKNLCRIWQGKPCLERSLLRHPVPPSWPCLAQRRQLRREAFHRRFHQLRQGSNLPKAAERFFLAGNQGPKD